MGMKQWIRRAMPTSLMLWRRRVIAARQEKRFARMTNGQIFAEIYSKKLWGSTGEKFCSGSGSRDRHVTEPYVETVQKVLANARGTVVDLGCGDFTIGRQLAPHVSGNYVAVDVVSDLIQHHQQNHADLSNVTFQCLDIVNDALPPGDIVMLRQVLQHLSNNDIRSVLAKLASYRLCIITEHQPNETDRPNQDKPTGAGIRLEQGSGVYLASPPFSIQGKLETILELPAQNQDGTAAGMIRTFLWQPPMPGSSG